MIPLRDRAWFCVKGAKRERSHAQGLVPEHGEHPPFDAGSGLAQGSVMRWLVSEMLDTPQSDFW